jgi:1-deoxyxylulose-5-phosphate synthase
MRYRRLGDTGLEVSALCLGCLSFGAPERGGYPWSLPEDASRTVIRAALDAGINFFDTANVYSAGTSEEYLGRAIADLADRESVVVATKVWAPMRPGPNGGGLSRKAIIQSIDASLRRLRMDYVDLYQIHRWDPSTPIEETMETLHDVVRAGKVTYIGASSMWAWQFAKAQRTADLGGWTRFVSMQDHWNLLAREIEREMMAMCVGMGVGVLPWSPLARGRLTRPWSESSTRLTTDDYGWRAYVDSDAATVAEVGSIATARNATMAQVALAWLLQQPAVTAPVIGVTSIGRLREAVDTLDLKLSDDEASALEAEYQPRPVLFA